MGPAAMLGDLCLLCQPIVHWQTHAVAVAAGSLRLHLELGLFRQ
jgi:hypothetical protein